MVSEFKLSASNSRNGRSAIGQGGRRGQPPQKQRLAATALPDKTETRNAVGVAKSIKSIRAEDIIPLNDDDFSEF